MGNDVIPDVFRRINNAFPLAHFVGVFDDDAPAVLQEFVGEESLIDGAHDVLGHAAEVIAVEVLEWE